MPVLDFVEHRLYRIVVVNQRFADAIGKARVMNELAQALTGESQVVTARNRPGVRLFFRPWPFWQCGERLLPNAH